MSLRDNDYYAGLIRELCKLPNETEWLEFKSNLRESETIGQYISALSNSAALLDKTYGYLVWGVNDTNHQIEGTSFRPYLEKIGNEELESWLLRLLNPRIDFRFHEIQMDGVAVVLLEIGRAFKHPVSFSGTEYIRVGSYKKSLKDFPEKERALWRIFDKIRFETLNAEEKVSLEEVLLRLDYSSYFDLLELPLPDGRTAIIQALIRDKLVSPCEAGGYNITNLGALLFAKRLEDFPTLKRKAMRVIQYKGTNRVETQKEQVGGKGYASGFEGLIGYINNLLPSNEVIQAALRKTVPMFPELAIRELVANALIHQDLSITGAGPMVEIFSDRLEITNPGIPLVDTDRFIDSPPISRNEDLASLMRRFRICEERGSGIDKVVAQVEEHQLPAPLFEVLPNSTRTVLFAHKPLNDMEKDDRVRACYLHACLKHQSRGFLTNTSLRERFQVEEHNRSIISRLIKEALDAGKILPYDPEAAPKMRKYAPWWAISKESEGT